MNRYDYVVIGGGSSGCVVASRLSEDPGVRVCLVEAGPDDTSALIHMPVGAVAFVPRRGRHNWGFETVPQRGLGGRRGYQPRGRTLGGSSSINAMCYVRGHASDYDRWAASGARGWSYAEVLPYFKRSENQARGASEFHGVGGPLDVSELRSPSPLDAAFIAAAQSVGIPRNDDFNGPTLEGVGMYQVTQAGGERRSAARAFLTPARSRPNLTVLTETHVQKVLFEGRRATGALVRTRGEAATLHAEREVIVSAGALQSPQLLMLSGIGPAEHLRSMGIEVVADVPGVGENLQDHPDYVTLYRSPSRDAIGLSMGGAVDLWRAWREYRDERRGRFTSNFAEAGAFVKSDPHESVPDLQLFFVVVMVDDHARRIHLGHGFSCHVCVLRPKSRGTVRLASPDPFAAPLVDPDFLGDPEDMTRMVKGFRIVRRILRAEPLAPWRGPELYTAAVETDEEIREAIRARADTVYHPVGTCRMGSDAQAVVDPELRVRGVEGLRVVDCSVMPTIVSGNTNAPAIMIGEKAADLIRSPH